jgi:hypothetical protein
MTLPKAEDEQKVNLFNRANNLRRLNEFDKAVAAYESILNLDSSSAEAHWGLVLSKFGIEYVEEPKTHERIPTCHRVHNESILADSDYLAALNNAPDAYTKSLYEEEAKRISDIQKGILAISSKEEPYDVFICYKETTDGGTRTKDSALAQDLYYQLEKEGFKVFFSRISLEKKLGQQYEPYIFNALNSAKVMLVVGTKPEYLNALWVKNEWSRFLALMKKDKSKLLIPCYRDMDAYDLPEEMAMLQSQDMGRIGFAQDILHGIKKVAGKQESIAPQSSSSAPMGNSEKLMKRAWQFAEDGDWGDAADYFNKVLDDSTDYAPAFLGLLCVDLKVSAENKLAHVKTPDFITNHKHYKRAVADPATKSRLDGYIQTIKDRIKAEKDAAAAEAERKRKLAEEAARKKRVQDVFDNACKLMKSAQSPDDYRKAITAFSSIDSNYQDINSQIKGKITECETKKAEIEARFKKKYGVLLERLSKEGKANAAERRKAAQAQLDEENAKAKTDAEAKYAQLQQQYNVDYKAWQEEINRLQTIYVSRQEDWEADVNKIKTQSEAWRTQRLCPHDGGTLKGLLAKKCSTCGKIPSEPLALPFTPLQPHYPAEPLNPQMPLFTPRTLEAESTLPDDVVIKIDGNDLFVNLGGIDWRVLIVENNKALLISERVHETQEYNTESKDITWERCTLRQYLNTEFYNKLGTAKAAVATTNNQNLNNQWYGTSGENSTQDKVFLLSLDEVCRYFGDSTANLRKKNSTYYFSDSNDNSRIAYDMNNEACWWWLRSPGDYSGSAASVHKDGNVYVCGFSVSISNGGVRPALWLNL